MFSPFVLLVAGTGLMTVACERQKNPTVAWSQVTGTDAPGSDRDRDGVTDDRERAMGSNLDSSDTDKDDYADGFEDRLSDFGFNLVQPDADRDRDGLTDAREKELGTDTTSVDSDGDGWGDFDEELNRYFGFDPRQPTADIDFDGLGDDLEKRIGSSPDKVDSNEDGISDFLSYSADQPPGGPKLQGVPAEMIGVTYSEAMGKAIEIMRARGDFPTKELGGQLPYPDVTAPVLSSRIRPSAALMQRSLYNPHNSPGLYPTYAEIEQQLAALASTYDGSPKDNLVRLFYWTGQTQDTCNGFHQQGGRKIYAVKISDKPADNDDQEPEVAFLGLHHARELHTAYQTMELLRTLTDGYANNLEIRGLVEKREVWVIPVVNPNGYERAVANQIMWRKNAHLLDKQSRDRCGVDVNRNYGFDHLSNFPPAQRAALPSSGSNGVDPVNGNFILDSDQFPGLSGFSEVETQAVRGLAHSQFLTRKGKEVDGLVCMLTWHSFGGIVGHPMGHKPIPPNTGLDPPDVSRFSSLTSGMASAAGYTDIKDTFPSLTSLDGGCAFSGYSVYGDSNDWFYKDQHTFAILIESYSASERGGCHMGSGLNAYSFYPQDLAKRDLVAQHNVNAALTLLQMCPP